MITKRELNRRILENERRITHVEGRTPERIEALLEEVSVKQRINNLKTEIDQLKLSVWELQNPATFMPNTPVIVGEDPGIVVTSKITKNLPEVSIDTSLSQNSRTISKVYPAVQYSRLYTVLLSDGKVDVFTEDKLIFNPKPK